MITNPKKYKRKGIIQLVIGVELICFAGALAWFEKMKWSQDYRHTWYKRYPKAVEGYYWCMENAAPKQKEGDFLAWGIPFKEKKS